MERGSPSVRIQGSRGGEAWMCRPSVARQWLQRGGTWKASSLGGEGPARDWLLLSLCGGCGLCGHHMLFSHLPHTVSSHTLPSRLGQASLC